MNDMAKNLILWVIIAIVLMSVFNNFSTQKTGAPVVSYSQFLEDVRQGTVAKVTINGRQIDGVTTTGSRFSTYSPGDDGMVSDLINNKVEIVAGAPEKPSVLMQILINWFPLFVLIGLWIFFMRQMQGGGAGRGAMSFGKSRARLLSEDQVKVNFNDVAGCEEAKDEVQELVEFLRDPGKFQKLGGKIPRGVLMVGPPGTGKTLLARAIAGEAKVPFFTISGSDFVEMFVGVGASRVRDMFEQAKKHAPCIIFIDEIDAVGRHRGSGMGGGHDEREQTLNQLLVEMDGFEASEGVIIIAATNRADVLDPAILRPGRFDRRITVPRPDIVGRMGILNVHTKKVPLSDDVDLDLIARGTPGFSGADIENLVNEAALLAARQDKDFVSMSDFEMAKDKVLMGAERRSMVISEKEKKTTAWHEAGHTLIGLLVPNHDPITKVSIIPRGQALGITMSLPKEDRLSTSKEWLLDRIAMTLGGRVAEEVKFGQITTGASNDFQKATQLARAMVTEWGMSDTLGPMAYGEREDAMFSMGGPSMRNKDYSEQTAQEIDAEVRRIITEQYERAKRIVTENLDKLDLISEALLERETIDGLEIEAIMAGRELPPRTKIVIPRYSEKSAKAKPARKTSIFQPRPREVPSGG